MGRTEVQLALLIVGMIVWAVGQRMEIVWVQWAGIACFGAATALRFLKKKTPDA